MKRSLYFPCFVLGLALLGWTSLPSPASDKLRALAVQAFAPAWRCADGVKEYISDRPIARGARSESAEAAFLRLENQRLKAELDWAKEWMLYEAKVKHERKFSRFLDLLELRSKAIPAQVIYRDPSAWSSSLWIGAGDEDNREAGYPVVARNSPVVEGSSLVGVVEYVGKRQSRVRLITDSGLAPAVRVLRNGRPAEILGLIDALSEKLKERAGRMEFVDQLQAMKESLGDESEAMYLAKGELRGAGAPFWRSMHPVLKGVGFNYDYPDAEGPARDLRTGRPLSGADKPVPLILEGDLLVTSGLDGVFPRGLSVALATKVAPLKEGSYSFEIEARPTACCLNDLKTVFVLPPLSGE